MRTHRGFVFLEKSYTIYSTIYRNVLFCLQSGSNQVKCCSRCVCQWHCVAIAPKWAKCLVKQGLGGGCNPPPTKGTVQNLLGYLKYHPKNWLGCKSWGGAYTAVLFPASTVTNLPYVFCALVLWQCC